MTRILVSTLVAAAVAGGVTWFIVARYRRRKAAVPELNRHPERLDQMLDETDDA